MKGLECIEAVGLVGSLPGHGATDLLADLADLAAGGEFGKQMLRQRKEFGLTAYGGLTSWDEFEDELEAVAEQKLPRRSASVTPLIATRVVLRKVP